MSQEPFCVSATKCLSVKMTRTNSCHSRHILDLWQTELARMIVNLDGDRTGQTTAKHLGGNVRDV